MTDLTNSDLPTAETLSIRRALVDHRAERARIDARMADAAAHQDLVDQIFQKHFTKWYADNRKQHEDRRHRAGICPLGPTVTGYLLSLGIHYSRVNDAPISLALLDAEASLLVDPEDQLDALNHEWDRILRPSFREAINTAETLSGMYAKVAENWHRAYIKRDPRYSQTRHWLALKGCRAEDFIKQYFQRLVRERAELPDHTRAASGAGSTKPRAFLRLVKE